MSTESSKMALTQQPPDKDILFYWFSFVLFPISFFFSLIIFPMHESIKLKNRAWAPPNRQKKRKNPFTGIRNDYYTEKKEKKQKH